MTPTGGSQVYKRDGRPFLRSQNVGWGNLLMDDVAYINDDIHNTFKSTEIQLNDVLLNITGASIGRSAVATHAVIGGNVNQHVCIIRTNDQELHHYYLNLFLLSKKGQNLIDSYQAGGNRQGLNFEHIRSFKIPLPGFPEQTAIANVLSAWDKAIQTTTAIITQKQNRKKWLMQQLLTGKKRLTAFAKALADKKGVKGNIWPKKVLGEFLEKHNEKTTDNNQYPVLTSSRNGIFLQKDYYTRDVASEDNTGYNVVPRGYFTYRHMSDDLIFKFNINDIVDRGIVSTLYPVFSVKNINKHFLSYKLNEGWEFKNHALQQKQGGSRTYMYFSALEELSIYLPSIDEQNAITNVFQTADKEIQALQSKLDKLKEQKKGLMQVLLTGKKRLKIKK